MTAANGADRAAMPQLALLACGGTIATISDGPRVELRSAEHLVRSVDRIDEIATVHASDVLTRSSHLMGLDDLATVAKRAVAAGDRDDLDGVVVTHGTDVLEETAFLTSLWYGGGSPIVFTGAQRDASTPNGDGPGNLRDAVRLAVDPRARGLGVLLCFAGEVIAADHARKTDSVALRAFSAADGPAGFVGSREVRIDRVPDRAPPLPIAELLGPVHLLKLVAGADGTLVRAAAVSGARGLVLETFGAGTAPRSVVNAVRATVEAGVLVAITTRCERGGLWAYPGPGGLHDLEDAGAVPVHGLDGPKARILLLAALGATGGRTAQARDLVLHRQHAANRLRSVSSP